jgi:hypothetical protein
VLTVAGGLSMLSYLGYTWLARQFDPASYLPLSQRPLLTYATGFMLLGAQMLSIGILAEMLASHQSRDEPAYSIAERAVGRGHDLGAGARTGRAGATVARSSW